MYFAEDNRALLLHYAYRYVRISVDLATTFTFMRVFSMIFLKLKSIESETEKKPDPTGRHVLFAGRR